ncbi:MAG: hypothetical protein WCK11_00820 [Candidatus Falkowbacteria bacterium]
MILTNAQTNKLPSPAALLTVYGLSHALIDFCCAATIFSLIALKKLDTTTAFNLIIWYNILAFGLQAPLGLIVDKLKMPQFIALIGLLLTIWPVFFYPHANLIVIALSLGIGNALFHLCGGQISLLIKPGTAMAPGIFVAPGAFGLFLGTFVGKAGTLIAWPAGLVALIVAIGIWQLEPPKLTYKPKTQPPTNYFALIILLLLIIVGVRSLVGIALVFPWKTQLILGITLVVTTVLGKAFGGAVADRFGWMKTAVVSLLIALPLLTFGAALPVLALIGVFFFQFTMPITLAGLAKILPGHEAFAFGLTCLALLLGSLLAFTPYNGFFTNHTSIISLISISVIAAYLALKPKFFIIQNK